MVKNARLDQSRFIAVTSCRRCRRDLSLSLSEWPKDWESQATRCNAGGRDSVPANQRKISRSGEPSASSHKWEAYRRRRFGRLSRRERRSYLDPHVRSEQRRKPAKAPWALRVGLKRVRLRRCSLVTYRSGYAPHSRLASKPF